MTLNMVTSERTIAGTRIENRRRRKMEQHQGIGTWEARGKNETTILPPLMVG